MLLIVASHILYLTRLCRKSPEPPGPVVFDGEDWKAGAAVSMVTRVRIQALGEFRSCPPVRFVTLSVTQPSLPDDKTLFNHGPGGPFMSTDTTDDIAWARRVNSRWIVRQGLRASAAAYLDRLESIDPERLQRSCHRARRLTDRYGSAEDPKPWFYAGLFSLATREEADEFLTEHYFTLASLPGHEDEVPAFPGPDSVAASTWEKILRIREGVAGLARDGD